MNYAAIKLWTVKSVLFSIFLKPLANALETACFLVDVLDVHDHLGTLWILVLLC